MSKAYAGESHAVWNLLGFKLLLHALRVEWRGAFVLASFPSPPSPLPKALGVPKAFGRGGLDLIRHYLAREIRDYFASDARTSFSSLRANMLFSAKAGWDQQTPPR